MQLQHLYSISTNESNKSTAVVHIIGHGNIPKAKIYHFKMLPYTSWVNKQQNSGVLKEKGLSKENRLPPSANWNLGGGNIIHRSEPNNGCSAINQSAGKRLQL